MTNGEKIQQDFKCEVCEPIIEDNIIHVIFADKPDSAIGFDYDWWNAEYKEPTIRNCFGCKYSKDNHNSGTEECHLCMWENQYTPITKNNLGVDAVSRKAVINQIFYSTDNNGDVVLGSALRERIANLPSITPIRPKGHWIDKQHLFSSCSAECSSCHKRSIGYTYDNGFSLECTYYNFCPICGSDNREVEK